MPLINSKQVEAIRERKPFGSPHLIAYYSKGDSYLLAIPGKWTDSGRRRDLVVILPAPIDGRQVIALTPMVNPRLVDEVEAVLA